MPRTLCPPYSNFKLETQLDYVKKMRAKRSNQAIAHRAKYNSTEPGYHQIGMMPKVGQFGFGDTFQATAQRTDGFAMNRLESAASNRSGNSGAGSPPKMPRDDSRMTGLSLDIPQKRTINRNR